MPITFKIGDKGARAKLAKAEGIIGGRGAYKVIGNSVLNQIRMCFRLGRDPWGQPWAELKLRNGQPLRETGRLQGSMTARPDDTGVTIGTNLKNNGVAYPAVHQFGAEIAPKKGKFLVFAAPGGGRIFAKKVMVPARPFLPMRAPGAVVALPPAWSVAVVRALRTYMTKELTDVR